MVVGDLAESTEVAILGAGTGGYVAAIRAAQYGKEVTIVYDEPLPGGECLQRGCIPSKALIEVSHFWEKISDAAAMGIFVENPRMDFSVTQAWKEQIILKLSRGVETLLKQNGVKVLKGRASFLDAHTFEIQGQEGLKRLHFEKAIVATGSRSKSLDAFPIDGKQILASQDLLRIAELPKSLLVLGGGYIGLELGEAFAKLGSQVTVLEATAQLLPGLDPALVRPVSKKLKALKVDVHLEAKAKFFRKTNEHLLVDYEDKEGKVHSVEAEKLLVAVGRVPNSEDLGLEKIGIKPDKRGFIPINESCQTSVPHIYAIGDVAGGMLLAHKASREGVVAAAHLSGHPDAMDSQVPAVIFTDPEIAYVGLSEAEAAAKSIEVETGMFGFAANGRAMTLSDTEGFVKLIAEKSTGRLLGAQIVGPQASTMISEATLAVEMGARAEDLDLTIHPHPTLSEAVHEAAESILGMAIHRYERKSSGEKKAEEGKK